MPGGPALARLRRRRDFQRLMREGRTGRHGPVTVRACRNEVGTVRVALAVGRRVGRAVVRNRVRRRLREALRADVAWIQAGIDLLVSVRPEGAGLSFGELRDALRRALRKAGAWAGPTGPSSTGQ